MGGGMLKLEPSEAQNVVLASAKTGHAGLSHLALELDALVRTGDDEAAQARADSVILQQGLGLSPVDCRLLRTASETLRNRRYLRETYNRRNPHGLVGGDDPSGEPDDD